MRLSIKLTREIEQLLRQRGIELKVYVPGEKVTAKEDTLEGVRSLWVVAKSDKTETVLARPSDKPEVIMEQRYDFLPSVYPSVLLLCSSRRVKPTDPEFNTYQKLLTGVTA